MIRKTMIFSMITTCYVICMFVFADTCYEIGRTQGFKDGQQATLTALEHKLGPFIDTCNKAIERLRSINNQL